MNHLSIKAEGVVINGVPSAPTEEGIFVMPGGFQGWEGITTRRREAIALAVEHGEHDAPVLLGARTVTVDAQILALTERTLGRLSQDLVGIGANGNRFDLEVYHQGQTLKAQARCVSADATDSGVREGPRLRSIGQIQFVCPDPRKYGDVTTFPGTSVDAYQRGNFPAHPVIEIPSAPAAWTVTSPGGTVQVSGATAGGTHRFDMLTGLLTRDGTPMPDALVRGDIWAIPRGEIWTHALSVTGRVLVTETYI